MSSTINWNVTYESKAESPDPFAELYQEGEVVQSRPIPCKPPVNCQFVMDDVMPGDYLAAIAVGEDRYYYTQGQTQVNEPNDSEHASIIHVDEMESTESVEITVNLE